MKLYRITSCDHVNDLSGEGAYLYGGRWNNPGTRILYTAESMALSMLEALAHITMVNQKRAYCRVVLDYSIAAVRETRTTEIRDGSVRHQPGGVGSGFGGGLVRHQPGGVGGEEAKVNWCQEITIEKLPPDWRSSPGPDLLKKFGDDFITAGQFLALKVPSVLAPDSFNYLLNPKHELFKNLTVASVEEVSFDYRLIAGK